MNKLSILVLFSFVALAFGIEYYEYDFIIGVGGKDFVGVNATVTLHVKNSRNTEENAKFSWQSYLVSDSNQTVNASGVVKYKVEEFTQFWFEFRPNDNKQSRQITLKDFYIVPKYFKEPETIEKKTVRICPENQTINAYSPTELKSNFC